IGRTQDGKPLKRLQNSTDRIESSTIQLWVLPIQPRLL
ncbi:hypothetical protein Goari_010131, partial [Gossypium aridum]|nr:hypothetical protein [Gossypium aridum]